MVYLCRDDAIKGWQMSAEADQGDDTPRKGAKLPLIMGLALGLAGAGGGYAAVEMGLIGGGAEADRPVVSDTATPDLAFVALDPLIISLPGSGGRTHLRFLAQLEVTPGAADDVRLLQPRIVDVLNGYLRAVDLAELEDPTALIRLRAQMLRRVQVVTGAEKVRDLLIMEFVLS